MYTSRLATPLPSLRTVQESYVEIWTALYVGNRAYVTVLPRTAIVSAFNSRDLFNAQWLDTRGLPRPPIDIAPELD